MISPLRILSLALTMILLAFFLLLNIVSAKEPTPLPVKDVAPDVKIGFDQVAKILKKNCAACHSGAKAEANLVLDTPQSILKGGDTGPGFVKNKSEESLLFLAASHKAELVMPPPDNKVNAKDLSAEELGILKAWIDNGATGSAQKPSETVKWKSVPAHVNSIYATAICSDDISAAVGVGNRLVIVDIAKGKEISQLVDPHLSAQNKISNVAETANNKHQPAHQDLIQSLAFSPNGEILASGAFREIKLWRREKNGNDETSWKLERTIGSVDDSETLANRVLSLDFSPDGKLLISGGGEPTRSGEIKIWNVADGTLAQSIKEPHSDTVFCVRFSPNGNFFASAAADRMVKVFKSADGTPAHTFEGHTQHVLCLAWKRDSKTLVSGGADSMIKVWNIESGEQRRTIQGYNKEITSLAFSGETSRVIVGCGNNTVKLANIDGGNNERTFNGFHDFIFTVSSTPDGKRFIAAGAEGMLNIFELTKSDPLRSIDLGSQ